MTPAAVLPRPNSRPDHPRATSLRRSTMSAFLALNDRHRATYPAARGREDSLADLAQTAKSGQLPQSLRSPQRGRSLGS